MSRGRFDRFFSGRKQEIVYKVTPLYQIQGVIGASIFVPTMLPRCKHNTLTGHSEHLDHGLYFECYLVFATADSTRFLLLFNWAGRGFGRGVAIG